MPLLWVQMDQQLLRRYCLQGLSSTAKVISVVRSSVGPEVVRPLGGPPPSTLASRTLQQGSYNANGEHGRLLPVVPRCSLNNACTSEEFT
jgi:hypothetical protein